jgi:CRP/FNR family transcriptional regulator, cyclic AMP receptor protein
VRLRKEAKIDLLATVPLFARCSKRELAAIAALASEVTLPEGHTLMREGAPAYSFFVLVEGTADVRRNDRGVATLGPGDFIGELALVLRRPRTATVTLTSPSRLLSVSAHNFSPLLAASPQLQRKLLETLARRLEAESA